MARTRQSDTRRTLVMPGYGPDLRGVLRTIVFEMPGETTAIDCRLGRSSVRCPDRWRCENPAGPQRCSSCRLVQTTVEKMHDGAQDF